MFEHIILYDARGYKKKVRYAASAVYAFCSAAQSDSDVVDIGTGGAGEDQSVAALQRVVGIIFLQNSSNIDSLGQ